MQADRKDKTIPLIAFLVIQAIIVIIIAALIFVFKKDEQVTSVDYDRQPAIDIRGLASELPDDPSPYVAIIQRQLAKTVELNTEIFDIAEAQAIVRQGTLKVQQFDRLGGYYFSAVVDIPDLQQSYQIFDHYPGSDTPPNSTPSNMEYVLCLDNQTEVIYPEFRCRDMYPANTRTEIVSWYLEYFNFDYFSAYVDPDDSSTIIVSPSVTYDNNETTKSRYVEEVKSAVGSLGVSPDSYKYYVRTAADVNYYNPY